MLGRAGRDGDGGGGGEWARASGTWAATRVMSAAGELRVLGVPVLALLGAVLMEYHVSEVLLVLCIEPEEFDVPATFLVTRPYLVAMAGGLLEFGIGALLAPEWKAAWAWWAAPAGLAMIVVGEGIRKAAWLEARKAFTHKIKLHKRPCHRLVTSGVYRHCRHPGYLGWFIWAVGTQMLLANAVCVLVFVVVSWRFFNMRISYEEHALRGLFGVEFEEYRQRTPTLIPGIP